MNIQRVTVVGAGTMGSGIAHVFALHGYEVMLVDVDEQQLKAARGGIDRNLKRQIDRGKIPDSAREEALERLGTSGELEASAASADFIIEAVPEQKSLKQQVLQSVDRAARDRAILASNTSSISITWLAAQTDRPNRVIGMHFFNPVPVMQLVEIVRGYDTSDEVFETVRGMAEELDKVPVEVEDYPGFVSNRVLMPMINEAIYCVMEGVAGKDAIDTVMKKGMSHPMGPLQLADFIGLDVCLSIMEVLHSELGDDKYRPCPLLRRMVDAGHLGKKTGQGFYAYDK